MTEFHSTESLPHIPDDLTIPQFTLDVMHSLRPTRPAEVPWLIEDRTGRATSHTELRERTQSIANALSLKWNISEDDVVCLFSPNHVDYPVAIWAVHRLGGIVTPANPGYTVDELVHQLQTSKASLIFAYSDFLATALSAARLAGISPDRIVLLQGAQYSEGHPTVDDLVRLGSAKGSNFKERALKAGEGKTKLAFLSFSSGTTGKPKAVAIPHYAVIANVIQMGVHWKANEPGSEYRRVAPGDVAIAVLPFFHIYGLVVNLHCLLFCGMSIVVVPKFNFVEFLKSIVRHRITHLFVVPPQIVLLCKHPAVRDYDFSHVKYCMSGAAPLSGELLKQVSKVLPNASIGQGYGMTETCTTVALLPATVKIAKVGSAGALMPGISARVVKEDGSLAHEGEQGELIVKGPSMALGYLNNEKATKETFVDGWVRTGDEVIIKDNEVYVVDRLKEIMKVRGFQVAPAELEGHLLLHPSVADACVIGVPDEYSGEVPFAYVVVGPTLRQRVDANPAEADKLKAIICKHVSDAKVPYKWLTGGVEFIEVIPKNPSGKILRRVLRDKAKASRVPTTFVQAKL